MPGTNRILRLGLIGAGAIAQQVYLPVLETLSDIRLSAIVDTDRDLVNTFSRRYSLGYAGPDLSRSLKHVDAVIVAVPNYLHHPICREFLREGKHVLCEKPFTITSTECRDLVSLSQKNSLKLAVAQVRRFYPAARMIKDIIVNGELGAVKSFAFEEGTVFSWPTVSGFFFDREKAGGGVLMDIGIHLLDLLFWWIPCGVKDFCYEDDNLGGVEAFARADVSLSNGIPGSITMSRLSVLSNSYRLDFERGHVEWNPFFPRRVYLKRFSEKSRKTLKMKRHRPVEDLLSDFAAAIRQNRKPFVAGEDTLDVIRLIERFYQSRNLLPLGWLQKRENTICP